MSGVRDLEKSGSERSNGEAGAVIKHHNSAILQSIHSFLETANAQIGTDIVSSSAFLDVGVAAC